MSLTVDQFPEFFEAIHGKIPFPWQSMLLERVATEGWPEGIDLPTASGKTACMDVALFSLALSADKPSGIQPRRTFFVVDRRIVVDEAHRRAGNLARMLRESGNQVVQAVAARLRSLSGDSEPLVVGRMRGGTVRDDTWVENPAQPAIITTTVDQVGSRLLFRGYGPGQLTQSIYAGLAACDSLILLDEAHCAVPFLQTACAVRSFSGPKWCAEPVRPPLTFVVLSATLPEVVRKHKDKVFPREDERDRALANEELEKRRKSAKLAEISSTCDLIGDAAKKVHESVANGHVRIAVLVNRVASAARIHDKLSREFVDGGIDLALITGRMRPVDRERVVKPLYAVLAADTPFDRGAKPTVVVSTQCLEVGADFSFDCLITECASLDALRQRFGRLNRLGEKDRPTSAWILASGDQLGDDYDDPVYGFALARSWKWLEENAAEQKLDFSIVNIERLLRDSPPESGESSLVKDPGDAPTLLPAHLDLLCQTGPRPTPDPDVALYLHGKDQGTPEAQVVFRADLIQAQDAATAWKDAIGLLPPVSTEALRVPLWALQRWLGGQKPTADKISDVEGGPSDEAATGTISKRAFLIWRGRDESRVSTDPGDVGPGDTVVVPAEAGWADLLGHYFAQAGHLDATEEAYALVGRPLPALRLSESVLGRWEELEGVNKLIQLSGEEEPDEVEIRQALEQSGSAFEAEGDKLLSDVFRSFSRFHRIEDHPTGGKVLFGRKRSASDRAEEFADRDDTRSATDVEISLEEHLLGVRSVVELLTDPERQTVDTRFREAFRWAASFHDVGKADNRFQEYLRGGLPPIGDAKPIAKSNSLPRSPSARHRIRAAARLTRGFRHEMLSFQLAQSLETNSLSEDEKELALHLIASHHGHARPFAPVVVDREAPDVVVEFEGAKVALSADVRRNEELLPPPHRLDSGLAARYWRLTRKYGWWGLAYLEAVFRLADWSASGAEKRGGKR